MKWKITECLCGPEFLEWESHSSSVKPKPGGAMTRSDREGRVKWPIVFCWMFLWFNILQQLCFYTRLFPEKQKHGITCKSFRYKHFMCPQYSVCDLFSGLWIVLCWLSSLILLPAVMPGGPYSRWELMCFFKNPKCLIMDAWVPSCFQTHLFSLKT